jgi:hypothetical protein
MYTTDRDGVGSRLCSIVSDNCQVLVLWLLVWVDTGTDKCDIVASDYVTGYVYGGSEETD